jgi:hypothetical protein
MAANRDRGSRPVAGERIRTLAGAAAREFSK